MPEESGVNDPYELVLKDLYARRDQLLQLVKKRERASAQATIIAATPQAKWDRSQLKITTPPPGSATTPAA